MTKDSERKDRHSGTGVSGEAKKDGLKGWGKPGEEVGPAVLDKGDPNYVDPEDE